jgi:hypothetical protein
MEARIIQSAVRVGALVVALALSGCASMDEEECLTVDWRTIGFEDGAAGYAGDRIASHRKACAKHGVTPDLGLYRSGREEGLREFCRPASGYRLGAQGGGYGGVCPADLEHEFLSAYGSGRQLYTLESRVANATHQLDSKRRELNRAEDDVVKKSALAIDRDSTGEQRAQAVVDLKQLAERMGRLKVEIRELEEDRVQYERDLQDYRATVEPIR